jgi:hypothetical protein
VLCGFAGGETGVVLRALLAQQPGDRRKAAPTSSSSTTGSWRSMSAIGSTARACAQPPSGCWRPGRAR